MSEPSRSGPGPDSASLGNSTRGESTAPPAGPGVLTALLCERCGNVNLVRVKGCWYCETCHYKFDCYGW